MEQSVAKVTALDNGDRVVVSCDEVTIAQHVRVAKSWWSRARGLLATAKLSSGHGLWICPCDAVHMFGMLYSIDVVFLNRSLEVVKIRTNLSPFAMALGGVQADSALELVAGGSHALNIGDQLTFKQVTGS